MGNRETLPQAIAVWARIGLNSFGGPAGQISVMHRELVEQRGWVGERRFLHALNFCLMLPGPEAQQLATYLGWLRHGVRGGALAGTLFILPGFVVMMVLSAVYALHGDVGWVAGLLFGLQAAVIAIILQAVTRLGRRTLHTPLARTLAAAAFVALFVFGVPFPVVVLGAGVVGWVAGRGRAEPVDEAEPEERVAPAAARRARRAALVCALLWLVPVAALLVMLGADHVFTAEALLFSRSAVLTFGGAYAVLSYISVAAVQRYGWLSAQDMATGLGLAETTPGPLILVVQFVGFLAAFNNPGSLPPLVAGVIGACIAVWVTFVPCFLFIFAGAPYVERLRGNPSIAHALRGIGAAVVGVIANLGVWLTLTTLFEQTRPGPLALVLPVPGSVDPAAVAVAVLGLVLVFAARLSTLRVLALCAAAGLVTTLV